MCVLFEIPGGSDSNTSVYNAGDQGSIPGSGRSMAKEMAIHSSTIAWKIPWTEEPGRLQSMGLQRVGHNWATSLNIWNGLSKSFTPFFQCLYLLFSYLDLLHRLERPAPCWERVEIMNIFAFFLILWGEIHLFTINCNVLIFFLLLVLDLLYWSFANFSRSYLRSLTFIFPIF